MELFDFVVELVDRSLEAAKKICEKHFERESFGSELTEVNNEVFAVADQMVTAYITVYCSMGASDGQAEGSGPSGLGAGGSSETDA